MKKIDVGLIGFGNVGSGVVKILSDRKNFLSNKIGLEINIKKICDKDISSRRNVAVGKSHFTKDAKEIINDPQVDIIVELMGGIHPAKEYIAEALKKGKSV